MTSTQTSADSIQLTFLHTLDDQYLRPGSHHTDPKQVDIKNFLEECSCDSFKKFLVNGKREMALLCFKASILRSHLSSVGITQFRDDPTDQGFYWNNYLKWTTYFFEEDITGKKAIQIDSSSTQLDIVRSSYFLDKERDIFFCLLPVNVDISSETMTLNEEKLLNVGVKLYYDMDLIREKVFNYKEATSLSHYLLDVQSKSRPKTAEHILYTSRIMIIMPCLSIHSSFTQNANEIFLRIFVRNEMKTYIPEEIKEGSILTTYFRNANCATSPHKLLLLDLYCGTIDSLQMKFESSVNQGIPFLTSVQDAKIHPEYLNFLDCHMVSKLEEIKLRPGESLNIIYRITRREVLKYRKNKTMIYLESPYLKQVQQSKVC